MNDKEKVQKGFWPKVRRLAGHVPFVETAVSMYYCSMDGVAIDGAFGSVKYYVTAEQKSARHGSVAWGGEPWR